MMQVTASLSSPCTSPSQPAAMCAAALVAPDSLCLQESYLQMCLIAPEVDLLEGNMATLQQEIQDRRQAVVTKEAELAHNNPPIFQTVQVEKIQSGVCTETLHMTNPQSCRLCRYSSSSLVCTEQHILVMHCSFPNN